MGGDGGARRGTGQPRAARLFSLAKRGAGRWRGIQPSSGAGPAVGGRQQTKGCCRRWHRSDVQPHRVRVGPAWLRGCGAGLPAG